MEEKSRAQEERSEEGKVNSLKAKSRVGCQVKNGDKSQSSKRKLEYHVMIILES